MVQDARFFGVIGVRWYVEHRKTSKQKSRRPSMGYRLLKSYDNSLHIEGLKPKTIAQSGQYDSLRSCAEIERLITVWRIGVHDERLSNRTSCVPSCEDRG